MREKIKKLSQQMLLLAAGALTASLSLHYRIPWIVPTTALLLALLVILFLEFEKKVSDSRKVALIGLLTAVTVVSRHLLHGVGGASPVFFFVILSGYSFGPLSGFMVGSLTMLLSNMFLGQGPWTPFQMVAMGFVGVFVWIVPSLGGRRQSILLAAYGFFAAYFYGAVSNLFFWLAFVSEHTLKTFVAVELGGLYFDTIRAGFTALILLFLSGPVLEVFERYGRRF